MDRIGCCISPPTITTTVGAPVAENVFATAAFHTGARSGFARRPPARIIRAVDQIPCRVTQTKILTSVAQPTGVNLVGGDIGDGGIIRAFEQEETMRRDRAVEREIDIATVGECPAAELDRFVAGVE